MAAYGRSNFRNLKDLRVLNIQNFNEYSQLFTIIHQTGEKKLRLLQSRRFAKRD